HHRHLPSFPTRRSSDLAARPEEKPKAPAFPYIPNRTARMASEAGVVFELLVEQVDHPVLWQQSMEWVIRQGIRQGVEFGSGKVLDRKSTRLNSSHVKIS